MNVLRRWHMHVLCGALCVGLALSMVTRSAALPLVLLGLLLLGVRRLPAVVLGLVLAGSWWGSVRLESLDRSPLSERIGTAERARIVITGPPRRGRFDIRATATAIAYGELRPHEPVLVRLPGQRAPPQGAILEALAQLTLPRGPSNGFDERKWLRRHGIHVVMRVDEWGEVGRRHGLGGIADRLRSWLGRAVARDLHGERAAVLEGIVLGDDAGLSDRLRARFRASGLYHLLAVSGQNVALVAGGMLTLAWLIGLPRWLGQVGALLGIACYMLAVGPQPSVIRAGIAGALGSLAWLSARMTDRWYFLLVGAAVLLAWNPYTLLDAGFELSFAAVAAIFVLVPRIERMLDGYPVPRKVAQVVAVSAACAVATAPVMWSQFHAIPLLAIPANALAAPAMAPLLALALAGAALTPLLPSATAAIAWVNGWLAAYLAACARIVGGLPGAQVTTLRGLLLLIAGTLLIAAYASRPRWRTG